MKSINKVGFWLVASAATLFAPAVMAAACSTSVANALGNASTDDVRLNSFDSVACAISGNNPDAQSANSSGFSAVFTGNSWSALGGYGSTGVQDIGPNALTGVNFSFTFARDSGNKSGTWSITADQSVTMDLVFAMHAGGRAGNFFFDDVALVANTASTGTWRIEWLNNGGQIPGYSNAVVFGRDIVFPPPPPPPPPHAIPEPETYLMMLAGLGLMGFMARRRKRNVAV